MDVDVGHTLAHFLYTGLYETLSTPDVSKEERANIKYRRALMTYYAARTYELHGLAALAQNEVGDCYFFVEFSAALGSIKAAFASGLSNDKWLRDHLDKKLSIYFTRGDDFFNIEEVTSHIGSVSDFDKAVVDKLGRISRESLRPRFPPPESTTSKRSASVDLSSDEEPARAEEPAWGEPPEPEEYQEEAQCEPPAEDPVYQDEEAVPEPPPEVDHAEGGYAEEVKPDEDYHYPPDDLSPPVPDQAEEGPNAPTEDYDTVLELVAPEPAPEDEYVPAPEKPAEDTAFYWPLEAAPEPPPCDEPVPEEPTMERSPAEPTDMGVPMDEPSVADPPDGWSDWGAAISKKKKRKNKGKPQPMEVL